MDTTRKPARRLFTAFLVLALFATIALSAHELPELGAGGQLVDFDAFYIVGQLAQEGRVAEAYDSDTMAAIQRGLVGHGGFMPWSYPPPFDLIAAPLPLAPRALAYTLFTAGTLALYLATLARLAGGQLGTVLIALFPPLYVTAIIGQNAFLTGALMGLFCLAALRGRGRAGLPLGLLVIKPHLGVGLGVYALAAGRWRVLALAAAVALAACALATLAFGVTVWPAFFAGLDAAGAALERGFYPFFRMASVYALLHSLGAPPAVALWAQAGAGLAACAAIVWGVRAGLAPRRALALAVFASALVSPYLYDYDLTLTGIGLALIAPELARRAGRGAWFAIIALFWLAGGWGLVNALPQAGLDWAERVADTQATPAVAALAYLALMAVLWRVMARPEPAR